MRVLFCAVEMAPLVKAGGLADVARALPKALNRRGHDVRVVLPFYGCIARAALTLQPVANYTFSIMGREEPAAVWKTETTDGVTVYLIENARFFGGPDVYTPEDNDRFYYFGEAALRLLQHIDWQPEILHCHDWHTGLIVSRLKTSLKNDPVYSRIASVLSIHNLGYQGWFSYDWAQKAGILDQIPPREHPLHSLMWRMIALGIYRADIVSTVSETYSREILTPSYWEGLEALLQTVRDRLAGIFNGLDYDEFNPAADPAIPHHYDCINLENKAKNKAKLQIEAGFPPGPGTPLLGFVGRFTKQKGTSILVDGIERILSRHAAQFVILGQTPKGEEVYGDTVNALATRHPLQVKVINSFDEAISRRVYAGSDILLMPSLYEPCGLGQLISLRYGTIPIVRRTGGLADTVVEHPAAGNGFLFDNADNGSDLTMAFERALDAFKNKEQWARMVIRAMNNDVSWERSCRKYEELYRRAVELRGGM